MDKFPNPQVMESPINSMLSLLLCSSDFSIVPSINNFLIHNLPFGFSVILRIVIMCSSGFSLENNKYLSEFLSTSKYLVGSCSSSKNTATYGQVFLLVVVPSNGFISISSPNTAPSSAIKFVPLNINLKPEQVQFINISPHCPSKVRPNLCMLSAQSFISKIFITSFISNF